MSNETATQKVFRGMRVVAEALRNEDFPMDRHAIDYAVGDVEIEDGKGGYVPVRELTDRLGEHEFVTAEDVVRALKDGIERRNARKAA